MLTLSGTKIVTILTRDRHAKRTRKQCKTHFALLRSYVEALTTEARTRTEAAMRRARVPVEAPRAAPSQRGLPGPKPRAKIQRKKKAVVPGKRIRINLKFTPAEEACIIKGHAKYHEANNKWVCILGDPEFTFHEQRTSVDLKVAASPCAKSSRHPDS